MEELLARLRATLRRDDAGPPPVRVKVGRCEIDLAAHTALEGDKAVRLTPTQWRLLEILLYHPGQLVGTQRLLAEIWDPDTSVSPITCASTWPGCAASWRPTRPVPAIC